ncbi:Hypothetical protein BCD_1299 (plasmid) [Borrelia crocidurae DOU]|uniref:Uncharacterized protein n=1 Tax=Borrelia crocidurae DOU TaxID=1293575 RepID=W5SKI2_9SPIR|nr:DUF228 domain-containing protein [Borrelia crocidurae]AHH07365.1 Hypothetical protein BCD_1299 [Borrelia crocidurae DOU]
MADKSALEASVERLTREKDRLESELASLKLGKQSEVLMRLKDHTTYPAVFDKEVQFGSRDIYFAHRGSLQYSLADKFENYQDIGFCYKRGVKLVVQNGMSTCVTRGGGNDLYGICIDYDDLTRTATVISIANSFECILLSDMNVKSGDKLIFDDMGVLSKVKANGTYMQALALSDALEFKDKSGFYGAKVMLISKPL